MIAEDIKEILDLLLERSKRREVNWIEAKQLGLAPPDESGEDYVVSLPNSSINIWRSQDPENPRRFFGSVLNSEGVVVVQFDSSGSKEDAVLLEELLTWAKRSALKADETLEDIKRALANKGPVGSPKPTKKDDDIPF